MADDKKKNEPVDPIDGTGSQVEGFQEGVSYPKIATTPKEFAQLLENPDLPAERQSAPAPELLNPQLFQGV